MWIGFPDGLKRSRFDMHALSVEVKFVSVSTAGVQSPVRRCLSPLRHLCVRGHSAERLVPKKAQKNPEKNIDLSHYVLNMYIGRY